jgi:hypothetical protein
LANEGIEIVAEGRVGRALRELMAQGIARQPSGPLPVRHDVGDRFSVHCKDYPVASAYCVDDLARPVA